MNIRELQKAVEEFIFVGQAHKAGVFLALHEKPDGIDGFAARMKFDRRAAGVLLEALVEMGYLKKRKDEYSVPKQVYRRLVEHGGKEYEGDFWSFMMYLINPWRTLPHVLAKGVPDKSSYANFSMDDFIRGMDSPWKKKITPEVVDLCLSLHKNAGVVADIGGAPGTIAREFAVRGLKTIIFDLPESMKVMKKELSKVRNIEIREGDATKTLPDGSYDIAFLGNLCHGQSPQDNAKIIRMCHEHLNPGGLIVIFDNLRGENTGAAVLALHMITQSPAGNIYTRGEYTDWLKQAGFKKITVKKLSDPAWSIVAGYK